LSSREKRFSAVSFARQCLGSACFQEVVCSDGRLVTISTDTVQLARRDAYRYDPLGRRAHILPSTTTISLWLIYYGHPENRPLVQWLSPQKLQITIPNFSGVGLQSSSYEGVNIIVKFEPDDPIARGEVAKGAPDGAPIDLHCEVQFSLCGGKVLL